MVVMMVMVVVVTCGRLMLTRVVRDHQNMRLGPWHCTSAGSQSV